jgi:pilus assembly protein CpaC
MISRLLRAFSCALLVSATVLPDLAMAAVATEANAPVMRVSGSNNAGQRLTLGLNKAEVIELDSDIKDVDVAGPDIVSAVVKSPRRILLIAQKVGQTNVMASDANGRRLFSLDVRVEKDTADLAALLRETMPNSAVKVTAIADNVVLAGNVASSLEAKRAYDVAVGFTGDPKKVVNMLSVMGGQQVLLKVRVAEMSRTIAKQFAVNTSGAVNVGGVPILTSTSNPYGLLGHALSDASGAQIGSSCGAAQFLPKVAQTINNAATSGFKTDLVIDPVTKNNILLPTDPLYFETAREATDTLNSSVSSNATSSLCPNNAQGILNGLEQIGLLHMLADPDLVSVNGETAKTLVGGSFPVPTAKDNQGNVTLEFKDYGVGLSFTPVVLSPDHISIQMSTEVSELTNAGAYILQGGTQTINGVTSTVPGLTIPALAVRRASTTIEMPSGGSMAIAGLVQHVNRQVIDGFPGLKDLPVLGALARSRDLQNDETELVVLVSAYLVQPNAASAFALPTDGFVPPSDPETLLMGRLNATYKKDDAPVKPPAESGFIVQ